MYTITETTSNMAYTFDDILLIPQHSSIKSRKDVSLAMTDLTKKITLDLPIFSANMETITESEMCNYMSSKGGLGVLHRFMSIEQNVLEFQKITNKQNFVSIGISDNEKKRAHALYEAGARYFCVDVAHADSDHTGDMVAWLKTTYPEVYIMAGNVVTADGTAYLIGCGADLIKVGIGSGAVCTTRIKTGFGMPQISAIAECAEAANALNRSIVADGGIRHVGDIVKALAFGADFVMLGGLLSGIHYTPGQILRDIHHLLYKTYRGMASKEVALDKLGGLPEWKTAEGISTKVPYKNEEQTEEIFQDIIGGMRSGLTYGGSHNFIELQNNMQYSIITSNGRAEGLPHILQK